MKWLDDLDVLEHFDKQDLIATLVPGLVVVVATVLLLPHVSVLHLLTKLSIGGFLLLLVLSYAAGLIIQAVAGVLDSLWWKLRGGPPTARIRMQPSALLEAKQVEAFNAALGKQFDGLSVPAAELSEQEWAATTTAIHAALEERDSTARIDELDHGRRLFSRLAAAAATVVFVVIFVTPFGWKWFLPAVVILGLTLYRMGVLGERHARELYTEFLKTQPKTTRRPRRTRGKQASAKASG